MNEKLSLSIAVPALDEAAGLEQAVRSMVAACREAGLSWEILIIDDGSSDGTAAIADRLALEHPSRVLAVHHERPRGVGACIREGAARATKDVFTWLPGDGENDAAALIKSLPLLEGRDLLVPYITNPEVRPLGRRLLSRLFVAIMNLSFGTDFRYTNGTVVYRRKIFDAVKPEASGFLAQVECLVKARRAGLRFAQVPMRLNARAPRRSKALTLGSLKVLWLEYLSLLRRAAHREMRYTVKPGLE
jgi:glycosyltransferase involved in cell wall biosynthesis